MADHDCKSIAEARFQRGNRRSEVYQAGFLDALELKLNQRARPALRWAEGSVEFDAYFAGWDEGLERARALIQPEESGR